MVGGRGRLKKGQSPEFYSFFEVVPNYVSFKFSLKVFKNKNHKSSNIMVFSDISELENRFFFLGKENKITLSRFYNIRFLCYYSMNWYPFDLQTCSIMLKMKARIILWAGTREKELEFECNADMYYIRFLFYH